MASRTPQQSRSIKAKQAILDAALVLFTEKGFHGTNSREIADSAGVSVGTFYSYYPDKKDLFAQAVEIYQQRFNEKLTELLGAIDLSSGDRRALIRQFVVSLIGAHDVFMGLHDELAVMVLSDPDFRLLSRRKAEVSRRNIRNYLERFRSEITIDDLDGTTAVVYDLVNSVVDTIVFDKTSLPREQLLASLVETLYRVLFSRS